MLGEAGGDARARPHGQARLLHRDHPRGQDLEVVEQPGPQQLLILHAGGHPFKTLAAKKGTSSFLCHTMFASDLDEHSNQSTGDDVM